MGRLTRWMDLKWHPSYAKDRDHQIFRERILATVSRESIISDVGAGECIVAQMNLKGLVRSVCGVDLNQRVVVISSKAVPSTYEWLGQPTLGGLL